MSNPTNTVTTRSQSSSSQKLEPTAPPVPSSHDSKPVTPVPRLDPDLTKKGKQLQVKSDPDFGNAAMMEVDTTLSPGSFGGASEDAELWWSSVESWSRYRRFSDSQAVAAVSLLLKDGARHWYNSLPAEDKEDLTSLKSVFLDRYAPKTAPWQDRVALFETSSYRISRSPITFNKSKFEQPELELRPIKFLLLLSTV